jgi:signal transduction histidine kinase
MAVLLTANGFISWRLYKQISAPLQVLEDAAHQIKEENLNTPVIYYQDNEFQRVCHAFEEMRLRLKNSLARQLKYEDNRKELLSSISHDLKTPITAIKGYVEGIRDGIADTPEKAEKYMETIHAKAVQVDNLIDRLFFYSKLDMGKIPFQFRTLDLIAFLYDSLEELRLDYPKMELQFEPPDQEVFVHADSTHLHRVITNLVGNAVKYSTDGRPVVVISAEKVLTMVELTLGDNGPGIDDELLPRMFESFSRSDASRSSHTEGSGLGLSIARQIIEAHGGTIKGKNSTSGGLEIHFSLRLADEEDSHN